jgi:hypothetical protein
MNKRPISPVEHYLNHLDRIFGVEPVFFVIDSATPGLPDMTGILYHNIPEKGFTTAFTYGLSLGNHASWKLGRPELSITVQSDKRDWADAAVYLANQLRSKCPFTYGETINFHAQICPDSNMDAFFVFAPSILERADYMNIEVGTDYKIHIAGLYPIYSSELPILHKMGLKDFWHHPKFDMYDIHRSPINT